MGREKYRHRIMILRRVEGDGAGKGGYASDAYKVIFDNVSCSVIDEKVTDWGTTESAKRERIRLFEMRPRDIRDDDLIVWKGVTHRVKENDGVKNLGREIRVRAALSTSRYTIKM